MVAIIELLVITYIHANNGWLFSNTSGSWGYPAFSLALLGNCRYSVLAQKYQELTE